MAGGTPAAVIATGTTPRQAMDIHMAIRNHFPDASLLAPTSDEWHYGDDFGFTYVDLSPADGIQAGMAAVLEQRTARIAADLQRDRERGLSVERMIDPLSIVLIMAGTTIATGLGNEIGKDIWSATKRAVVALWKRRDNTPEEPAATRFDRLAQAIGQLHSTTTTWNPVVLLQVAKSSVTFIIEPHLTDQALADLQALANGKQQERGRMPLRWNEDTSSWQPVGSDWQTEDGIYALRDAINERARSIDQQEP